MKDRDLKLMKSVHFEGSKNLLKVTDDPVFPAGNNVLKESDSYWLCLHFIFMVYKNLDIAKVSIKPSDICKPYNLS